MRFRETLAFATLPLAAVSCSLGGEQTAAPTTTAATTIESGEATLSSGELTADQCLTLAGVIQVLGEEETPAYFFFGDENNLMGGQNVNVSWLPVASEVLLESIELPDGTLPATEQTADVLAASGTLRVAAEAYNAADIEFARLTAGDAWKTNNGWDQAYIEADAMLDQARGTTMNAFSGNCDPYVLSIAGQ